MQLESTRSPGIQQALSETKTQVSVGPQHARHRQPRSILVLQGQRTCLKELQALGAGVSTSLATQGAPATGLSLLPFLRSQAWPLGSAQGRRTPAPHAYTLKCSLPSLKAPAILVVCSHSQPPWITARDVKGHCTHLASTLAVQSILSLLTDTQGKSPAWDHQADFPDTMVSPDPCPGGRERRQGSQHYN